MRKGHPRVLLLMYAHICSQVFHFASVALTAAVPWWGCVWGLVLWGAGEAYKGCSVPLGCPWLSWLDLGSM